MGRERGEKGGLASRIIESRDLDAIYHYIARKMGDTALRNSRLYRTTVNKQNKRRRAVSRR